MLPIHLRQKSVALAPASNCIRPFFPRSYIFELSLFGPFDSIFYVWNFAEFFLQTVQKQSIFPAFPNDFFFALLTRKDTAPTTCCVSFWWELSPTKESFRAREWDNASFTGGRETTMVAESWRERDDFISWGNMWLPTWFGTRLMFTYRFAYMRAYVKWGESFFRGMHLVKALTYAFGFRKGGLLHVKYVMRSCLRGGWLLHPSKFAAA